MDKSWRSQLYSFSCQVKRNQVRSHIFSYAQHYETVEKFYRRCILLAGGLWTLASGTSSPYSITYIWIFNTSTLRCGRTSRVGNQVVRSFSGQCFPGGAGHGVIRLYLHGLICLPEHVLLHIGFTVKLNNP